MSVVVDYVAGNTLVARRREMTQGERRGVCVWLGGGGEGGARGGWGRPTSVRRTRIGWRLERVRSDGFLA